MSGRTLAVWLPETIDVDAVLSGRGWSQQGDHLRREGRSWFARAEDARRVFPEDVPEAVDNLLPGITWLVELWYEGRAKAADQALEAAARAIATAGHGVISDGHQAWLSGGIKRSKPIAHAESSCPPLLLLSWWAAGGPLLTREGIARLVSSLERLLPEALPARWDTVEPPSHGLAVDGTAGLVDFLCRDSGALGLTFLWPKKPVYDLGIHISDWGGPFPYFMPVWFRVGIDAEILNQPGWARQLPRAFAAFSHIIRPFYGDARVDAEPYEGADLDHPHAPGPTSRNYSWYGVPREPPIAMVVGPEYLSHWPEAARDVGADGLAVFNNDLWPAQPLGGCPVPPPSIAERPWEPEPLPPHMWPMQLRGQAVGGGLPAPPMKLGPQRPEIWPFGEERHSRGLPASDPTWPVEP
jgi:hypothetical protein